METIDLTEQQPEAEATAHSRKSKKGFFKNLNAGEKILTAILLIIFLALFYIALDANKYQATVRVIEGEGRVGINPTTELLDFGDLSRGTSAVRRVNIANRTNIPMYILVVRLGSITDLVDLNKNNFILSPGQETKLEFTSYIPASAEIGKIYNGRVFIFRIPWLTKT